MDRVQIEEQFLLVDQRASVASRHDVAIPGGRGQRMVQVGVDRPHPVHESTSPARTHRLLLRALKDLQGLRRCLEERCRLEELVLRASSQPIGKHLHQRLRDVGRLPAVLQRKPQVGVGFGKVRLQCQCPAVAGDRFVQLPLACNDKPQVGVGLGKVRLQFQCPAAAGDRLVQLPLVQHRNAQVVVRLSIVRLQFQCPAVAGDRFLQLPLVPQAQCPGCCAPRQ